MRGKTFLADKTIFNQDALNMIWYWYKQIGHEAFTKEDVECNSPLTAGTVILGTSNNGWVTWKNKVGDSIDIYRKER